MPNTNTNTNTKASFLKVIESMLHIAYCGITKTTTMGTSKNKLFSSTLYAKYVTTRQVRACLVYLTCIKKKRHSHSLCSHGCGLSLGAGAVTAASY
jgi:hypothetical protein